ncbi:MAG: hypothetical protein KDD77_07730 [Caldilineaceae bacterium]|nr:hypothetical protein [Caldilineaceae bacterium]
MSGSTTRQWLVALFCLGCLLFSYPLLDVFNQGSLIAGIPVLAVYLFVAWGLVIGLMVLLFERRK